MSARGFSRRRSRRRLARDVEEYARAERHRRLGGGVTEYAGLAARTALYGEIASLLNDTRRSVSPDALAAVRTLLDETPPPHDYGGTARSRDERVASILTALERGGSDGEASNRGQPGTRLRQPPGSAHTASSALRGA
jgi:hypothetical protein